MYNINKEIISGKIGEAISNPNIILAPSLKASMQMMEGIMHKKAIVSQNVFEGIITRQIFSGPKVAERVIFESPDQDNS